MKKIFTLSLIAMLLFPANNASAADKACPKTKLNQVLNNKVCLKINDSYRWTSLPTKTTSTSIEKPILKQEINFKENIFNNIKEYKIKNNSNEFEIKLISTNNVNVVVIEKILNRYKSLTGFWGNQFKSKKLLLIIGTNDDLLWTKNQLEDNLSPYKFDDWYNNFNKNIKENRCRTYNAGSYGINNVGYYVQSFSLYPKDCSDLEPNDNNYRTTVEHEFSHAAQQAISNNNAHRMPCWFVEGYATYYGSLLGNLDNYNNFIESRNFAIYNYFGNRDVKKQLILLDEKYNNFTCGVDGGYAIGSMAVEQLLKEYSNNDINNFMYNISLTNNWRQSFLNIFKISFEQWVNTLNNDILKI